MKAGFVALVSMMCPGLIQAGPLGSFSVMADAAVRAAANQRKAELRAFDRADTDGDDLLDSSEWSGLFRALDRARQLYARTGRVSTQEISEQQEIADTFFNWFDADQDGFIDPGEWLDLRAGWAGYDKPDFSSSPALDLNGNGKVTRSEVLAVLSSYLPRSKDLTAWSDAIAEEWNRPESGPIGGSGGIVVTWPSIDWSAANDYLSNLPDRQGGPAGSQSSSSSSSNTASPGNVDLGGHLSDLRGWHGVRNRCFDARGRDGNHRAGWEPLHGCEHRIERSGAVEPP
ncbi:MAG: EF-hand domain-containing protein [Luteolibacter sp.]